MKTVRYEDLPPEARRQYDALKARTSDSRVGCYAGSTSFASSTSFSPMRVNLIRSPLT
jgi:hypothetical protein